MIKRSLIPDILKERPEALVKPPAPVSTDSGSVETTKQSVKEIDMANYYSTLTLERIKSVLD